MRFLLLFFVLISFNTWTQNRVFKAIDEGSYDILSKYIEKGKDLNIKTPKQAENREGSIYKDEFTLLEWAVIKRAYPAIEMLLDHKDQFENLDAVLGRSLCIAASTGDLNVTQMLINEGADVNYRSPLFQDLNPTYISVLYTNLNTFFYLVENNGNVHIEDKKGLTLLHQSAFTGVTKVSEFLINEGVSPFQKDDDGRTPLMYAAWAGNFGLYKLLIEKGADIHLKSDKNESVFMFSIIGENIFIIKDLLRNEADINEADIYGNTPLFFAVDEENIDILILLINKGADLNTENKSGETPLSWAIKKSNKEIVVELIENGAKMRSQDKDLIKEYFSSKSMRKYLKSEWKKYK